jgi:UDP-N-acetylmuramyl pentapeptide synthase
MNLTRKAILLRRLTIALPAVTLYLLGRYQSDNFLLAAIIAFFIGCAIVRIEKILRK